MLIINLVLSANLFQFAGHFQVSCGQGGEKLLGLAEGLLKKHIASHSLHEPEGLFIGCSSLFIDKYAVL